MHIMAPLANLSYPLQYIGRSISRLASSAGSARSEQKMRYQRRNSCSDSTTKIQRFFGISFRRSKSLLAESHSKVVETKMNPDEADALEKASLNAKLAEILDEFDGMLISQERKPAIPPKPVMYAITNSLYCKLKKIDDTKKHAVNAGMGNQPLHHIAACSAAWGPSLRPKVIGETAKRLRWVQAEIVK